MSTRLFTVVTALALAACSGSSGETPGTGGAGGAPTSSTGGAGGGAYGQCGGLMETTVELHDYPAGCAGLAQADALACAEQAFWLAFRHDFTQRQAAYDVLTTTIGAWEGKAPNADVAKLYFRRGQMAMVLAIEEGQTAMVLKVNPDFQKVLDLDPAHPLAATWMDTMNIALAAVTQDDAALQKAFDVAFDHVASCPLGNVLALSGTTIGLPLSTGYPQKTFELVKSWKCEGAPWCTANTWKAPFARPGLGYHFAEIYARMGDKMTALSFFDQALKAPDADKWPYRSMAEDNVANIDAYMGKFAALGQDGSGFNIVYANQNYGCKFCHAEP
jgi:hypothetical protein